MVKYYYTDQKVKYYSDCVTAFTLAVQPIGSRLCVLEGARFFRSRYLSVKLQCKLLARHDHVVLGQAFICIAILTMYSLTKQLRRSL